MRYESNRCRADRQRSPMRRFVGGLLRFMLFIILIIVLFSGGFWLLATAFGLAIGIVSLVISLAPLLIVGWLLWMLAKAILV